MKTLALLLATVIGLAACNTMAGFGKDMEKAGEKIQDKAKK
jgi:predicted small secreted protein